METVVVKIQSTLENHVYDKLDCFDGLRAMVLATGCSWPRGVTKADEAGRALASKSYSVGIKGGGVTEPTTFAPSGPSQLGIDVGVYIVAMCDGCHSMLLVRTGSGSWYLFDQFRNTLSDAGTLHTNTTIDGAFMACVHQTWSYMLRAKGTKVKANSTLYKIA